MYIPLSYCSFYGLCMHVEKLRKCTVCTCLGGILAVLLLACVSLTIYTGVMVNRVNSDLKIQCSTTEENFTVSLRDWKHGKSYHLYAHEVCVNKLPSENYCITTNRVNISLHKTPCKNVNKKTSSRIICGSFTTTPHYASFFWNSGTNMSTSPQII